MLRNLLKFAGTPTLALLLAVVGCGDLTDPAAPELSPNAPAREESEESNGSVRVAKESGCDVGASVTATVDDKGGVLKVCQHHLTVPAGAVSAPTVFVMTKLDDGIKVDLTATSVGSLVVNDVGSAGFLKALTLTLNYSKATNLPDDLSQMAIYWFKDQDSVVKQTSTNNRNNQSIIAYPTHFSEYAIGWPN